MKAKAQWYRLHVLSGESSRSIDAPDRYRISSLTNGVFRADGAFVVLPVIPVKLLEWGFRSEVLKLLVAEGAIGERLSASLLAWRHSGFSVHNGVRVPAGDHLAS